MINSDIVFIQGDEVKFGNKTYTIRRVKGDSLYIRPVTTGFVVGKTITINGIPFTVTSILRNDVLVTRKFE